METGREDNTPPEAGLSLDRLPELRKRLLDLSFRNRLLHFPHSSKGKLHIRVIDELPDNVFELLVEGAQVLKFRGLPIPEEEGDEEMDGGRAKKERLDPREAARRYGLHADYEVPIDGGEDHGKHTDKLLQTLLYEDVMEATLNHIYSKANLAIEETGSNLLHLALGFLEYSDMVTGLPRLAPLIVIPVELEKGRLNRNRVYEFELRFSDQDVLQNASLEALLAKDYNLRLPEYTEGTRPEAYFAQVQKMLAEDSRCQKWCVRRFITLGLFSFGRLQLYLDLDLEKWKTSLPQNHAARLLFGLGTNEDGIVLPTDSHEGSLDLQDLPIVCSADSSQYATLMEVAKGANMIIDGPPGTGKSQTISNIIAVALAQGKTVLFLAEKLAALEVVASRLRQSGLGHFILELHSHKVQKKSVIASLSGRMDKAWKTPSSYEEAKAELREVRIKLSEYARLAGRPVGSTGKNVHQVLCAAARYRRAIVRKYPALEPRVRMEVPLNGIDFSPQKASVMEDAVKTFIEARAQVDVTTAELWVGVSPHDKLCHELRPCFQSWHEHLQRLIRNLKEEPALCGSEDTLDYALQTAKSIQALPVAGLADAGTLSRIESAEEIKALEQAVALENEFLGDKEKAEGILKRDLGKDQLSRGTAALEALAKLFGERMSLDEIDSELSVLKRAIQDTARVQKLCAQVAQGSMGEAFPVIARTIGRVLEAAKDAPPAVLAARDEKFENVQTRQRITSYAAKAAAFQAVSGEIAARFRLEGSPTSQRLKQLEYLLVHAGLFAWFKPSFHQARRESLLVLRGKGPSTRELIQDLRRLANFKEDEAEITRLATSTGIPRDQIQFQWRVCQWYEEQELNLRESERLTLFRCQRDTLENLRGDAEKEILFLQGCEMLEQRLRSGPLGHVPLDQRTANLERLSAALGVLMEFGFIGGQMVKDVRLLFEIRYGLSDKAERLRADPVLPRLLGHSWAAGNERVDSIKATIQILRWLGAMDQKLRHRFMRITSNAEYTNLKDWADRVTQEIAQVAKAEADAIKEANIELRIWLRDRSLGCMVARTESAVQRIDTLESWIQFANARRDLESQSLKALADWLEDGAMEPEDAWPLVRYAAFQHTAFDLYQKFPLLRSITEVSQNKLKARLAENDKQILDLNREHVAYQASLRPVPPGGRGQRVADLTDGELIKHEVSKEKRHIPIRQLMLRAGGAVRGLKPCLMMGPQGVAHYLPPTGGLFDLLVIDEASQMRPEFALGSVFRAKQIVVVGDDKQLPPSDFFEVQVGEECEEDVSVLEEGESILKAAQSRFKVRKSLLWHYRSRHHTLIEFSNQIFYQNRLVVVPSCLPTSDGLGIKYIEVPEGRFLARKNVPEAERVADLVIDYMIHSPARSLAVVALNLQQADLIEDLILARIKEEPAAEDYLEKHRAGPEPFIIKNLENIQGDERDAVIVSMTYGPNEDGRISSNFGPINRSNGERRLNVLFTRAKHHLAVVCSMPPEKLDIDGTANAGPKIMRDYLFYARDGKLTSGPEVGSRAPDSDFEIEVIELLREKGLTCDPQVGVRGFWIDIGVRDPAVHGKYLLGIECDGASYHSSRAARDRDLLRQQLLEGLGWRIHRIWSTDWFANSAKQIEQILNLLRK